MSSINYAGARDNSRADDVAELLDACRPLLLAFLARADQAGRATATATATAAVAKSDNLLLHAVEPAELQNRVLESLPRTGQGQRGVVSVLHHVLQHSTNTWHQGFMDKLYGSTNPVGVAAELILAILNTNVHVFKVSPALTVIERTTSRALAEKFGLAGEHAGGIVQSGGSASNLTALVIARNSLFPETKTDGVGARRFVVFTSAHGHYSFEKAAQICGLGSKAVWSVKVDERGRMQVSDLEALIRRAREQGLTPLLVNGTAGTTVLGSYDPLTEIARVCRREQLWFHVDGSWGGGVVFSDSQRSKLAGAELADSIAFNPHKMLGAPIQCSFLLTNDLRRFWKSNTLPASYLFHNDAEADSVADIWDLADLTLQCGRRGDALKLALGWIYYGADGYGDLIDHAFQVAAHFAALVARHPDLILISENPAPCLQVCFQYAAGGIAQSAECNSRITREVTDRLVDHEFLVDYAQGAEGLFFRAVVSLATRTETVERLVATVAALGRQAHNGVEAH